VARGGKRAGAGRKPGALSEARRNLRDLAREHVEKAVKELARLATKAESETARVAAIKEILDRGYGKAPQPMTGEDGEGPAKIEITWQQGGS
jgi:hypothetical protein